MRFVHPRCVVVLGASFLVMHAGNLHAATLGTAFTYQGHLENPPGTPVDDTCNFRFGLWDADAGGNQIGASPQTKSGVPVSSGVFTVNDLDFGASAFDGTGRWLGLEVQCPGDGGFTLLSPRVELTPAPHALSLPGLYTQENATSPNVIGGHSGNAIDSGVVGATISGGGLVGATNSITDHYGTVGGGQANRAGSDDLDPATDAWATVGGGINNNARTRYSTVGGGIANSASGESATVGGGGSHTASGFASTIGGGDSNSASGDRSAVGAGAFNDAGGDFATVGGGIGNAANGGRSAVLGGQGNSASGSWSTVPGGLFNQAGGDFSVASGRRAKVRDAAEAGDADGDEGTFVWADSTDADFASTGPDQFLIRAGAGVGINTNAPSEALDVDGNIHANGTISSGATLTLNGTARSVVSDADLDLHVASGRALRLEDSGGSPNVIAGFSGNSVLAPFPGATISGGGDAGFENRVEFSFGTIGGGGANLVSGHSSTIAGGRFNIAGADQSTVGGGQSNTARRNSTVAGGSGNTADNLVLGGATVGGGLNNNALGGGSTVAGGDSNAASGHYATVPGGHSNAAGGQFSFAAGRRARVRDAATSGDADGDEGTFVWADSTNADFTSTGPNQFLVRASGGMGLNRNTPAHPLHVGTDASNGNGAHLTTGGTWTNGSSRQWKQNFREIDKQELLRKLAELPLMQWQYKGEVDHIRHIGPVAEDFATAFGLGHDEQYITTIDADGVAMAAIQGLHDLLQEKDCEIEELRSKLAALAAGRSEIEELRSEIAALKAAVDAVAEPKRGGR